MAVLSAAASGIVGTIAMLGLIYLLPVVLGGMPLNLPLFIGSLISSRNRVASLLGASILFFNGAAIACFGRLVLPFEPGDRTLLWGLGFGALLGLASIGVMKIMLAAHPKSADLRSIPQVQVAIILWLGHLLYGGCVALVFSTS